MVEAHKQKRRRIITKSNNKMEFRRNESKREANNKMIVISLINDLSNMGIKWQRTNMRDRKLWRNITKN